jgi:hypothetical protein
MNDMSSPVRNPQPNYSLFDIFPVGPLLLVRLLSSSYSHSLHDLLILFSIVFCEPQVQPDVEKMALGVIVHSLEWYGLL